MSAEPTGWQDDGTYVPCPECKWAPPAENPELAAFSTPLHWGGTTHHGSCPVIPRLSPEDERALHDRLAEMDRVRTRGAAEAMFYVIG